MCSNKRETLENSLYVRCDLGSIQPPPWPGANAKLILGTGQWIEPLKRLEIFSPEEFEVFVQQWAAEYVAKSGKYVRVDRKSGAGDEGRDIIGWVEPPDSHDARWDNFQCKHYQDRLTPSDFWPELGKLCYYTYKGSYSVPRFYYIVTHKDIGPALSNLLDKPTELRNRLITEWDRHCRSRISSVSIALEGDFADYVRNFDFSIVKSVSPLDLLEQHSKTKYHAYVFGVRLKPRPSPLVPPDEPTSLEALYVARMFEAFADHLNIPTADTKCFVQRPDLEGTFKRVRECFYCAESLKEFARDNLPDDSHFVDLTTKIEQGIFFTLQKPHADGYGRMLETHSQVVILQIATPLQDDLTSNDRIGVCHQLANEDRIKWVSK